jgi:hypothetical protein
MIAPLLHLPTLLTPIVLTVLMWMGTLSARADTPLDALCGATITEDLVLTDDIDCTGYTGVALTIGANDVTIDGAGFRLLAPDSSRAISVSGGINNATIRNIEVVGWCTGTGVHLEGGSGHTVENVRADGRTFGVVAQNTANLTVRNLTADASSDSGLYLNNVALPLILEGLRLTNSFYGLRVRDFTGPWTLDPTALADVGLSDTSVLLEANVRQMTLDGLALDGATQGILATAATNSQLTFRNLDLSAAAGTGIGLYLGGSGHRIENVTANRRSHGVYLNFTTDVAVQNLQVAGATASGLYILTPTLPLDLRNITVRDSAVGVVFWNMAPASRFEVTRWDPATGLGAIADVDTSDIGIQIGGSRDITVRDLAISSQGAGISAASTTNRNLIFQRLDVSARRQGGQGIQVSGVDNIVEDIVAHDRGNGVLANLATNVTLRRITAHRCTSNGVLLQTPTLPATLVDFDLQDNDTGLYLDNVIGTEAAPFVLRPFDANTGLGALRSVARSQVGVRIHNSRHVIAEDLVLPNPNTGLYVRYANNTHLTIRRCNLSASYGGVGLDIAGENHLVHDIIANDRSTAFYIDRARTTTFRDITAMRASSNGIYLTNYIATDTPPTFLRLTLRQCQRSVALHTVRSPMTFAAAQAIDTTDSENGYVLDYTSDITFDGLRVATRAYGIRFQYGNVRGTVRDCDLSGDGFGIGLGIGINGNSPFNYGGADHVVERVTAHNRNTGAALFAASNLRVTDFDASGSAGTGLYLLGFNTDMQPPVLSGIDVRDAQYGVIVAASALPMVFDENTGLDVTGCYHGIYLDAVANMTIRDLTLKTVDAGLYIATDNRAIIAENLDVSGYGTGPGIRVGYQISTDTRFDGGPDHVLTDIIAHNRNTGIVVYNANNLDIHGFIATGTQTALNIASQRATHSFPDLRDLHLTDNYSGILIQNSTHAFTLDGQGRNLVIARNDYSVQLANIQNATLRNLEVDGTLAAIYAVAAVGSLRFENLTLGGGPTTVGLQLGAPSYPANSGHVLRNIAISDVATGAIVHMATGADVRGLRIERARTAGLVITSPTLPLTLADISLTDSVLGMQVSGLTASAANPFVIGPYDAGSTTGVITSLSGNLRGFEFTGSSHVQVRNLTIPALIRGIDASATTNANMTFANLDLSGSGHGDGLILSGANHVVSDVVARDRNFGVRTVGASNLTLTNVTAARAVDAAVRLTTTTLPLAISGMRATASTIGLDIDGVTGTGAVTLGATALPDISANATALRVANATPVTVDGTGLGLPRMAHPGICHCHRSWPHAAPPSPPR